MNKMLLFNLLQVADVSTAVARIFTDMGTVHSNYKGALDPSSLA